MAVAHVLTIPSILVAGTHAERVVSVKTLLDRFETLRRTGLSMDTELLSTHGLFGLLDRDWINGVR